MMQMASVSDTLVDFNHLMQLLAHPFLLKYVAMKVSQYIHLMKQKTANLFSRVKYANEHK
jgi:hypothetical protein